MQQELSCILWFAEIMRNPGEGLRGQCLAPKMETKVY